MADDLQQMMRNKIHNDLLGRLDYATQSGDIQAARQAAAQLADFTAKNRPPDVPAFTNADVRAAIKAKAEWFGVDPRKSAKVVEFGKNMEPASFKSAEEFADRIIKEVEKEYEEADEEPDEEEEEEDEDEKLEKELKKVARKKTDAPSSSGARALPRRASSGPWTKLSDAPKEIAQQIKAQADKFTRNATEEQRKKYIATALGTAYNAEQRRGKK
jgi:hypothetical protein